MTVTSPAPEQHFKRVLGLPALVAFGLAYTGEEEELERA